MSKPEFVYVTFIETTPDKLWQALTNGDFTERYWFGYRLDSDWKVGSAMTLGKGGIVMDECVILESDPPRRISYSWHPIYDDDIATEKPSRVTLDLEPRGKVVKLTVTHQGFPDHSKVLPSISRGWPMVFASLKTFLETGQPLSLDPTSET
ncbi:SRPBCC family protein [Tardiphaga sp.]|uniref:SRPBCC family protein n=1 Tax=Tardiphaga sp. TaxID=1926292 RepID=UPI00352B4118